MTIAVVGAGFAGLRTAQLLERLGHDVTVYEARERVGGRAWTVHTGNGWYEAGGEWIDGDHRRIFALLDELGLSAEESSQRPGLLWFDGEARPEDRPWGDAEAAEARLEDIALQVLARYDSGDFSDDHLTLANALDSLAMGSAARWCVEARVRSDEGEDPDRVSLLGWAVGYRHYLERQGGEMSSARFAEGAQAVCEKMAATLAKPVRLGVKVEAVGQGTVSFQGQTSDFDHVVLALPVKLLGTVLGSSVFSSLDSRKLPILGSARVVKMVAEFHSRWWQEAGYSGRLMANRLFQQCWDIGRGGLCALGFYICGDGALRVLQAADPVQSVVDSLAEIYPVARDQFVKGAVVDWITDPWSQGAFSSLAPGTVHAMARAAEPLGRIHFAGEWASSWGGFYEGALESAERVAVEIGPG